MAHQHAPFEAHHHHHHHHEHVEYHRPETLNTNLGLYSLKKLNAMNPDILKESEKRLLQPSAPGVLTSLVHGAFIFGATGYTAYIYRYLGGRAFLRPNVLLPYGVIAAGMIVFQSFSSKIRELTL